MQLKDRIKELRRVPASELVPNPKNWRTHGDDQRDALRGVLAEIGIADATLARELPDGRLMIIDGHLRAETAGDSMVPVLVLDVTEAEADKILLTLDPLAAMAGADKIKLDGLLREAEMQAPALQEMLASLADEVGLYQDEKPKKPKAEGVRVAFGKFSFQLADSDYAAALHSITAKVGKEPEAIVAEVRRRLSDSA